MIFFKKNKNYIYKFFNNRMHKNMLTFSKPPIIFSRISKFRTHISPCRTKIITNHFNTIFIRHKNCIRMSITNIINPIFPVMSIAAFMMLPCFAISIFFFTVIYWASITSPIFTTFFKFNIREFG